jgi:hypothetical protein
MDLVPEFVIPEGREGQINLNTSEWLILSKIDGRRSIKAIANASSHSTFEACKILYGLIATNLIRLKDPLAPPPASKPSNPSAGPATHPTGRPTTDPVPRPATLPQSPLSPASPELLPRLVRIRDIANALLGAGGEPMVQKHVQGARLAIERGAGSEVLDQAIQQIATDAASIKGPQATDIVLERLRAVK